VQVTNEADARANWQSAVIKTVKSDNATGDDTKTVETTDTVLQHVDLVMGQRLIIRGTDASFFIPPTGITVLADDDGNYVRDAVTLERLEYCILLDENGNKSYFHGPDVVFPKPTETFVGTNGVRKFRATELTQTSGVYVKVIADYTEGEKVYKAGEELFITGKEMPVYFPRPEHAVVDYDGQKITYAVAIPEGEARYVLNRLTGEVALVKGPNMFLPDPRSEVVVRRVLTNEQVALWYPGNKQAIDHNERLAKHAQTDMLRGTIGATGAKGPTGATGIVSYMATSSASVSDAFMAEELGRKNTFTPPRTLVLDTKFDGAVSVDVWQGYAVMILNKTGGRRVVVGPHTTLLEYDETLMAMQLSTGRPKTTDNLLSTAYLRVDNNKVSDSVRIETSDLCRVSIKLSYRVNFEGTDHNKWFAVENYVKFLCDHLRSLIKSEGKRHGIEDFYQNGASIIRDTVLGKAAEGKARPGKVFSENGMRVYDVEVLDITIDDTAVASMLIDAQRRNVEQSIAIAQTERTLDIVKRGEVVKREEATTKAETTLLLHQLSLDEVSLKLNLALADVDSRMKRMAAEAEIGISEQKNKGIISDEKRKQAEADEKLRLEIAKQELALSMERLNAEVVAAKEKAAAFSPQLVLAMQTLADTQTLHSAAQNFAGVAMLENKSLVEVMKMYFANTPLEHLIGAMGNLPARDAGTTKVK
jgi:major vault protein